MMWRKFREMVSGIRTVLLLSYLIIILVCVTTVGTVSYYISYRSMSERVETASYQLARQIENNMNNELHSKRNLLLAPYNNPDFIDSINAYPVMSDQEKFLFRQNLGNLYLKTFNTTPIRDFQRFEIRYSNGELLNDSDNASAGTAVQVRQSPWFKETIAMDGKVHFFVPDGQEQAPGRKTDYSTAILIRDFANPDEFIIVRADYHSGLLESIREDADLTVNSGFLILTDRDRPVYVPEAFRDMVNPAMLEQVQGSGGRFWFEQPDGGMWLISYTRSAYSNWKTILITPKEDIINPLSPIKTAVMYTVILAAVGTFIMSLVFGRSITKPILSLYKSVNHMKRGNFSVRVDVGSNNEIGRIAMNFNAMQEELQKLIETKYVYQIKLKEMELAMLYSQINPHFLYNTLDSIKAMANYYQVEDIGEMAQSLADMFRYNIKNRDETVTLREELEQIRAYMKIQGFRFEDKIRMEIDVPEELMAYPVLKMTLQPLVENAVFHGLEKKRGSGIICIRAALSEEGLLLTISDDGVGIDPKRLAAVREAWRLPHYLEEYAPMTPAGNGIGVHNVYSRYAIRYGDKASFCIESEPGEGTVVTLLIRDKASEEALDSEKSEN
jgi:two-component system, sensor histidine kinase YesM